jgi:hypothetical protein
MLTHQISAVSTPIVPVSMREERSNRHFDKLATPLPETSLASGMPHTTDSIYNNFDMMTTFRNL